MKKHALFISIFSLIAYYSTQAMEEVSQSERLKKVQEEVEEQKDLVRANITKLVENQWQEEKACEFANTIHELTDNRKGTSPLKQHIERQNRRVCCCFFPWFD